MRWPEQPAVGIGEHRADGVHPEQLVGRDHDQLQGAGQVGHRV
jgi:hypothetical protein